MTVRERVTIPAQVVAREVGDEVVLLDLATGTYFGLNPVGARIWQLIQDGLSRAAIRDRIVEEYDVSGEQAEDDVDALIGELIDNKLVVPAQE